MLHPYTLIPELPLIHKFCSIWKGSLGKTNDIMLYYVQKAETLIIFTPVFET